MYLDRVSQPWVGIRLNLLKHFLTSLCGSTTQNSASLSHYRMQQLTTQNWTIYQLKKRERKQKMCRKRENQKRGKPLKKEQEELLHACMHTHRHTHTPLVWFLVPPSPICPSWCRTCQPRSAHKQRYIRCSCNMERRRQDKVRYMSGSIAQQTTQKCMLQRRISSKRFHSLPPPLFPVFVSPSLSPLFSSMLSCPFGIHHHPQAIHLHSHLLQKGSVPPVPSYQNEQVLQPHAVERAIMAAPLFQLYYQYWLMNWNSKCYIKVLRVQSPQMLILHSTLELGRGSKVEWNGET